MWFARIMSHCSQSDYKHNTVIIKENVAGREINGRNARAKRIKLVYETRKLKAIQFDSIVTVLI